MLPALQEEVKWNNAFHNFSWDEYIHAKQEIKRVRQQDLEDGIRNFSITDAEPIISQQMQLKMQQEQQIKQILLMRMHADLSRYLTNFFTGYLRMNLVKSAIA